MIGIGHVTPNGVTFINFAVRPIIRLAYGVPLASRLIGMPPSLKP